MTEHEHTPPIRCIKIYRLSPSQVNIVVRVEIVLNLEEVLDMIGAMERAFDDNGPQIVCEVIR